MTVAPRCLAHWTRMVADAARRRVDHHGPARRDRIGLAQQVARRHALDHDGGRRPVVHVVREGHQFGGLDVSPFRVRAVPAPQPVGHPVAFLEVPNAGAQRLDHAGGFAARDQRQPGYGRGAAPAPPRADFRIVEPDGGVTETNLALARGLQGHLLPAEDLGPAGLVEPDGPSGFRRGPAPRPAPARAHGRYPFRASSFMRRAGTAVHSSSSYSLAYARPKGVGPDAFDQAPPP